MFLNLLLLFYLVVCHIIIKVIQLVQNSLYILKILVRCVFCKYFLSNLLREVAEVGFPLGATSSPATGSWLGLLYGMNSLQSMGLKSSLIVVG